MKTRKKWVVTASICTLMISLLSACGSNNLEATTSSSDKSETSSSESRQDKSKIAQITAIDESNITVTIMSSERDMNQEMSFPDISGNQPMTPDKGEVPNGMQAPEGSQAPNGMQAPEGGEAPNGMQAPEGGQAPDGMQAPGGGGAPNGMQAPEDGNAQNRTKSPDGQNNSENRQISGNVPSEEYSEEQIVIPLDSDLKIMVQTTEGVSEGTVSNLTVGSFVRLEYDSNGELATISVMSGMLPQAAPSRE